jgi:hypothetical protein
MAISGGHVRKGGLADSPSQRRIASCLPRLAFLLTGGILLAGGLAAATPGRSFLFHWFGPDVRDCPPFDIHFAFERGAIAFQAPPTGPNGAPVFTRAESDARGGPFVISVGRPDCVIVFKIDRG